MNLLQLQRDQDRTHFLKEKCFVIRGVNAGLEIGLKQSFFKENKMKFMKTKTSQIAVYEIKVILVHK